MRRHAGSVFGFDLGTTNSYVTVDQDGITYTLPSDGMFK